MNGNEIIGLPFHARHQIIKSYPGPILGVGSLVFGANIPECRGTAGEENNVDLTGAEVEKYVEMYSNALDAAGALGKQLKQQANT